MKIRRIEISNFRNHNNSVINFDSNINVLYGPNGAGKTSILEAITIASLTKTYTNVPDSTLLQFGKENYNISLKARNYLNLEYFVEVAYSKSNGKKIRNSFGDNIKSKEIIGIIPIVFLSPDLKVISAGTPENRREFIDRILSQSSKTYVEDILKFKRALKQRNSILIKKKNDNIFDKNGFEIWTQMFIKLATSIITKRNEFIDEFNELFQNYYNKITNKSEQAKIVYTPNSIKNLNKPIEEQLQDKAQKVYESEINRCTTLFGPQKDDLSIQLNNGTARDWASQGQHKSILIAIKLAEFDYLQKFTNEVPIVLLDDIFSELDEQRSMLVLSTVLENQAQTILTMTNPNFIKKYELIKDATQFIKIENGEII